MLSIIHIVQLILFALMMSTGQFLFKKTAISIETINSPIPVSFGLIDGLFRALHVPWFYMAIFLYSLATLFWLYILQKVPLSIAYPFTATTMIWVPLIAYIFFGERLTYSYWMGIILIVSGIAIIGSKA